MNFNINFLDHKSIKINGDIQYQRDIVSILKKKNLVNYGRNSFNLFYTIVISKICNILLALPIVSQLLNKELNIFSRRRNYKFQNYEYPVFSHYFYNDDVKIKKQIWSTQGIMFPSYYKNYRSKASLKSDIELYKKIDQNNKTIFLFWDKKFALRTKKLCKLKSIIKIVPPTLSINENENSQIKIKINNKVNILFIGKKPKIKGFFLLKKTLEKKIFDKYNFHLDVVSPIINSNEKKFTYHNNINEIKKKKLLNNADIFILPSLAETFGYALMEALAAKCAIITFNYYPLNNFCKNNFNGFLIQKNSIKNLEIAILKLLKNKRKLSSFKKNSFKIYYNQFCQKQFLKKIEKIYIESEKNKLRSDI